MSDEIMNTQDTVEQNQMKDDVMTEEHMNANLRRRITGTCAKHQRRLALEIKRARSICLLPFVAD